VGNGMRVLKVLTVVMGVMILAGTGVLVAVIAHRMAAPASNRRAAAGGAPMSLVLNEPAGTRIARIAAVGDRLAVQLQGGGEDRVVLIDSQSGAMVGRITLTR
jgi:hypothetical protein